MIRLANLHLFKARSLLLRELLITNQPALCDGCECAEEPSEDDLRVEVEPLEGVDRRGVLRQVVGVQGPAGDEGVLV